MYGAVGDCLKNKGVYTEIHDSTCKKDFLGFMKNLAEQIKPLPDGQLPILVLDNHKAHIGADRRELLQQFC